MRRRQDRDARAPIPVSLLDGGDSAALFAFVDEHGWNALTVIKVRGDRRMVREGTPPRYELDAWDDMLEIDDGNPR